MSEGQYEYVDVVFASANTDTAVRHQLRPNTPEEVRYLVSRKDRACDIYDDQVAGHREWTSGVIYLRSSVAGARVRLRLFTERVNQD